MRVPVVESPWSIPMTICNNYYNHLLFLRWSTRVSATLDPENLHMGQSLILCRILAVNLLGLACPTCVRVIQPTCYTDQLAKHSVDYQGHVPWKWITIRPMASKTCHVVKTWMMGRTGRRFIHDIITLGACWVWSRHGISSRPSLTVYHFLGSSTSILTPLVFNHHVFLFHTPHGDTRCAQTPSDILHMVSLCEHWKCPNHDLALHERIESAHTNQADHRPHERKEVPGDEEQTKKNIYNLQSEILLQ